MRHGKALLWLWYQLVSAFSLGAYFLYVPHLADFVADSDTCSLQLSATHLLAGNSARFWKRSLDSEGLKCVIHHATEGIATHLLDVRWM